MNLFGVPSCNWINYSICDNITHIPLRPISFTRDEGKGHLQGKLLM